MPSPDFFIIGAPKCGTTALSEYLRRHPLIGFSQPKEPVYFCTDFPNVRNFTEEGEYLAQCFGHCRDREYRAIGEGSTAYIYSAEAIPNILAFQPAAKFIVMLRNPIDMVYALHAQKLLSLEEDVTDFERAWSLQARRLEGECLPKFCREPKLLAYANLGRLGAHLERVFAQVPEAQRKVLLFEDFVQHTRAVYLEVLAFLGVPDDHREEFPPINESQQARVQGLYEFGHRPPEKLINLVGALKRCLGIERLNILSRMLEWNVRKTQRKPLSPAMMKTLSEAFSGDIDLLAALLGRDLSHWQR